MLNIWVGKTKAVIDRQRGYIAIIMFFDIIFVNHGVSWWYLLAIPPLAIWVYIDEKYLRKSEMNYLHSNSPVMMEVLNRVKHIEEAMLGQTEGANNEESNIVDAVGFVYNTQYAEGIGASDSDDTTGHVLHIVDSARGPRPVDFSGLNCSLAADGLGYDPVRSARHIYSYVQGLD